MLLFQGNHRHNLHYSNTEWQILQLLFIHCSFNNYHGVNLDNFILDLTRVFSLV